MTVPPDAKLCVVWDVDGDAGDYSYLYGEGNETNDTHDIWIPSAAQTFVLTISDDSDDFIFPNWK
jgi:hypothetical protein